MTRINANLQQAYTTFVSTLAKHRTDPIVLEEIYQEKLERLDQSMDMLTKLAIAGMEEQPLFWFSTRYAINSTRDFSLN